MNQKPFFSPLPTKPRKDKSLTREEKLKRANYKKEALLIIANLPDGKMSVEIIRKEIERRIGKPDEHNIWGVIIKEARRQRYIKDTGERVKSTIKVSHHREVVVYEVGCKNEYPKDKVAQEETTKEHWNS